MPLSLTFGGAAGEVTGSATHLDTGAARVLVDFGLHQGGAVFESRNRRTPPFDARRLDAVVLTHAHIDHSGRLPVLTRAANEGGLGYDGVIWATPATIELAGILLRDAAFLQQADAERVARHRRRRGRAAEGLRPLFDHADAERCLARFRPLPCDRDQEIASGVTLRFADAGHILGSASALLRVRTRNHHERTIAFSADVGVKGSPLLRDPQPFHAADAVILESTYGDRDHRPVDHTVQEFARVLASAHEERAKVIIPAFAVGRTQTLIYHLGRLREAGTLPETPVYIDSPMATETTALYARFSQTFDDTAKRLMHDGGSPLSFPGLRFVRSTAESRALNELDSCAVIISASGMCNGGRILHHLRHSLSKPSTHLVIVGFQAHGTLGRAIVDGATQVAIMGESIPVRARVHTLGGFSAHAGQTELLEWLRPLAGAKPRIILNHGEDSARAALARTIAALHGVSAETPTYRQTITLD
jgi:metallo-beta-lactamase family protein